MTIQYWLNRSIYSLASSSRGSSRSAAPPSVRAPVSELQLVLLGTKWMFHFRVIARGLFDTGGNGCRWFVAIYAEMPTTGVKLCKFHNGYVLIYLSAHST